MGDKTQIETQTTDKEIHNNIRNTPADGPVLFQFNPRKDRIELQNQEFKVKCSVIDLLGTFPLSAGSKSNRNIWSVPNNCVDGIKTKVCQ